MSEQATMTELHEFRRETSASGRPRPVDPLRALAEQHRLHSYRDACGDWNIPGRWGEIFWDGSAHDGLPGRIGVQLGAKRRQALSPERRAAAIARLERVRPTRNPCILD
jgi:hypothetical protein